MRFLTISEQVVEHLRDELLHGRWAETLPGLPQLSKELGVDTKTVTVALRQLEKQGLLVPQGVGKRRRIALPEGALKTRKLRIGILHHDPLAISSGYMIELQHMLQEAGHEAFFAKKGLVELKMNVGRVARLLRQTDAHAWIVNSASREVLEWFLAEGIPAFALFGRRRELPLAGVGPDKVGAYREIVRRLCALGHWRIVLLTLKARRLPEPGASERAFLEEMAAQGIPQSPYNLPDWEESAEGIRTQIDALFRLTPPTALLLDEAYLFHAVKHHLAHEGIRVPEDVSLVCTDPDRTFAWCQPSIAHIAWDSGPVLRRVEQWAANVSEGKEDLQQLLTPAVFVEGGTIGRAKE